MWPYPWTHVGTPSHLGHMDGVAATMPSQAHAGAAQEAPDIGQWEGQDVPLVRPSSCNVKGGIPSSRRYLPTFLYGQTGQWLQVGIDLRGYDADYKAAAHGIRQKTFFVRAERAMGVDSRWGSTLEWAEWRAEHLVAPPGKKTIKTQDKSVYERVKDRVYGHVICRVDGHAIKLVDGGGGTGGGMGHCISVIAECSKDWRGKSSWFLLVWEAGGLDSPRIRRICQVVVDRALAKMPDLQSRIEHWGKSSTVSPPCGVEPDEPKAKRARVDGGPYRCTFATANFLKEFIRRGSLPVQGACLRQQFDVRDPSFCWTTLSQFVVWGVEWQMKRSVPVQKAKAEVEEMLSKGNPTQWLLPPEGAVPYLPLALVDSDQCTPPFTFCRPDSKGRLSSFEAFWVPDVNQKRLAGGRNFRQVERETEKGGTTQVAWAVYLPMRPPLGWRISGGARARVPVTLMGSARSFSSACIVKWFGQ